MNHHDPSSSDARCRLLVIDDEKLVGSLLARFLRQDFDVTVVDDAREALVLLDTERFDLVLTDLNMPGASGVDIIARAARLPHRPPVVVMSGYDESTALDQARHAGAAGFLEKPFNSKAYVQAYLEKVLREARPPDES